MATNAKALGHMLVDMRKDPETKTVGDKLEDVEAKALFDTITDTIAEADSETLFPNTTQCDGSGTGKNGGRHFTRDGHRHS